MAAQLTVSTNPRIRAGISPKPRRFPEEDHCPDPSPGPTGGRGGPRAELKIALRTAGLSVPYAVPGPGIEPKCDLESPTRLDPNNTSARRGARWAGQWVRLQHQTWWPFQRVQQYVSFKPARTPGTPLKSAGSGGPGLPRYRRNCPRKSLDFEIGVGDRLGSLRVSKSERVFSR